MSAKFAPLRRIVRTAQDRRAGRRDRPNALVSFRSGKRHAMIFNTFVLVSPEYMAELLAAAGEPLSRDHEGKA